MSSGDSPQDPVPAGGDDKVVELIVAVVALVISILAFAISALQALNQYYASASGYAACKETVIGKWHKFTKRRFLWSEFRIEVQFEVPVLFVASPENKNGPLGHHKVKRIICLDGGKEHSEYTPSAKEFADDQVRKSRGELVHTADNEAATWCALLMAIHQMENDSRKWQADIGIGGYVPPNYAPSSPPHSIVACMQRKRRTWDSMPKDIAKPYATTTISHMVELTAILGIYWKEFNLNDDRYRAQGNGFVIYGSYIDGLGIAFTFQKQGPAWFEENRVIPNTSIKELCFGIAPTIFPRRRNVKADEHKDVGSLQLGSMAEIALTLVEFGCDTKTVNFFRKNLDVARHSHIFPVPFEMLGMVGKLLYVEKTAFQMLPNPTIFHWDRTAFSLPTLIAEFAHWLRTHQGEDASLRESEQITQIHTLADDIIEKTQQADVGVAATDADVDQIIIGKDLIAKLDSLRRGIESCDEYLKRADLLPLAKQVVRVHFQVLLHILNQAADNKDADRLSVRDIVYPRRASTITILDIDSASFDEKHQLLAEMYLSSVRTDVVRVVCEHASRDRLTRARRSSMTGAAASTKAGGEKAPSTMERQVNEIWCTLVFRMLCWLQLHDFHEKDIQISKSDVFGSRMPVYIM